MDSPVTAAEAKAASDILARASDATVTMMLQAATDMLIGPNGALNRSFEDDEVPTNVKFGIIIQAGSLYQRSSAQGQLRSFEVDGAFRESYDSPDRAAAAVDSTVRALLARYVRPVLA